MIVSASYRTDIPAFYADWFRARRRAGFAAVANPYGGTPSRVPLAGPELGGFVFWTRNLGPFMAALDDIAAEALPFYVSFTMTGLPRCFERAVIEPERAIEQMRALVRRFGPGRFVWRYDPILVSDLTPPAYHRESFSRLADRIAGLTDEVVLSFAQIYRKTKRNLDAAARRHGVAWADPSAGAKSELLSEIGALALQRGLRPLLCAQPELLAPPLAPARCIDAGRLAAIAGTLGKSLPETAVKGNRPGCFCSAARDIGAYDSCPHGCAYCYAVSSESLAKKRYRAHRDDRESLGPIRGTDAQD